MKDVSGIVWTLAGWPGFIGGVIGLFFAFQLDEGLHGSSTFWQICVAGVALGMGVSQVSQWLGRRG